MIKLNIGCGDDYREGFINIDGSSTIGADEVIDLNETRLTDMFKKNSVDVILASDIIEHFERYKALEMLEDCYKILKKGGKIKIRVPDTQGIITNPEFTIEKKILFLYGGQDIPQENEAMDKTRKAHPNYFCHRYGWTLISLSKELIKLKFRITSQIYMKPFNIRIKAIK